MRKIVLLCAVALVTSTLGCRGWTSEKPPVHLNPNMDTQKKLKAYRANDFFPNGRVMQMPIEGTVPRTLAGNERRDGSFLALDDHFYTGMVDGKEALGFPSAFKIDEATLVRGQERYNIYCAPCHAVAGDGKGTVAKRLPVPPPSFHQERIHNLPLGSVFNTISHGKNYPNMPSYADKLDAQDRWAVIAYLRAMMRTKKGGLPLEPGADSQGPDLATLAGNPVAMGEAVYKKVCIACHSVDGSRLVGPSFKGLWGKASKDAAGADYVVDEAYFIESVREPNARIAGGDPPYPPAMPAQTPAMLSDEELQGVMAWIQTLK